MAKAYRVEDTCPKCGRHLILLEGRYGEFLGCPGFPRCRFTKPCNNLDQMYKPPNPYCKKCDQTGLLPFIKNGKIIPNVFLDCECRLNQPPEFVELKPEHFDFPLSADFRAWTLAHCGERVPDSPRIFSAPVHTPQVVEHIVRHSQMGTKEFDLLQQTASQIKYLQEEIEKLKAKQKSPKIKTTYKGLQIDV